MYTLNCSKQCEHLALLPFCSLAYLEQVLRQLLRLFFMLLLLLLLFVRLYCPQGVECTFYIRHCCFHTGFHPRFTYFPPVLEAYRTVATHTPPLPSAIAHLCLHIYMYVCVCTFICSKPSIWTSPPRRDCPFHTAAALFAVWVLPVLPLLSLILRAIIMASVVFHFLLFSFYFYYLCCFAFV